MRRSLQLHPESRCDAVSRVEVEVFRSSLAELALRYLVSGSIGELLLPPPGAADRTSGLWQTTCFEAFLRPGAGDAYHEFNFAPSSQWAAYRFSGYRSGMEEADIPRPLIQTQHRTRYLELRVDVQGLPASPWTLALSAVIEETNGRKSYWALAHPPGKADFHHPASFLCEL
jgi:hypothetical protein